MFALDATVAAPHASVSVSVVDFSGHRIDSAHLQVLRLGDKKDFSARFKDHKAHSVRVYRWKIFYPGFKMREQDLKVYQPIVSARIALPLGSISPPIRLRSLSGTVAPLPSNDVWIALVPVIDNESRMDSRVAPDGTFLSPPWNPGPTCWLLPAV